MEVVFQAHNAVISDRMKERASRALSKIARRLEDVVDATVRFNQDGPRRRVEIKLHAAGHRNFVAEGESRYYGPALNTAITHLEAQVTRDKGDSKHDGHTVTRT
ncbi:MAG: HPF/RaiA family ribosome-associated protein [Gemmatimonadaceae bacterium]